MSRINDRVRKAEIAKIDIKWLTKMQELVSGLVRWIELSVIKSTGILWCGAMVEKTKILWK